MLRLSAIAGCALLAATASGQTPQAVPQDQRGPGIGTRVPQFRLADQQGRERDFASLKGPNGLVLLLVRSADW